MVFTPLRWMVSHLCIWWWWPTPSESKDRTELSASSTWKGAQSSEKSKSRRKLHGPKLWKTSTFWNSERRSPSTWSRSTAHSLSDNFRKIQSSSDQSTSWTTLCYLQLREMAHNHLPEFKIPSILKIPADLGKRSIWTSHFQVPLIGWGTLWSQRMDCNSTTLL